jgi:putative heme-binding domain-containing protein
LREFCADAKFINSRRALSSLMSTWSRQKIQIKEINGGDLAQNYQPWFDWFAEAHPDAVELLSGFGGGSAADWQKRLAAIDWETGDEERGRQAYDRRSCAKCHGGSARLGPDLAGITGRLSRDDLFAAIVDPSRDVSPLYQTTQVVTRSGKVYHGLLVYESPEGTLVQTGADQTLRVAGEEILSMTPSRQSLMPTGLLAESSDEELADLYAYLRTLRSR